MAFNVPKITLETEFEVNKSKFFARAGFAHCRREAMNLLQSCKRDYPDARHHCWAYLLGDPNSPESAAMSDDGEPSGTAGKPIMHILNHKHVGNVMLVVSRYFGGIKLGAGGLVRAYSSAAQQTMQQLPVSKYIVTQKIRVSVDFKFEGQLRRMIEQYQGRLLYCNYSEQVEMTLELSDEGINAIEATSLCTGGKWHLQNL